jgi:hypothetical protein
MQQVKIYKRVLGPKLMGGGSPAERYQRDVQKMSRNGWRVVAQSEYGKHIRSITVTYQKD